MKVTTARNRKMDVPDPVDKEGAATRLGYAVELLPAANPPLTVGASEFLNAVPDDQVRLVVRALDNEARYRMVCLLRSQPMGVSELARHVGVSQPTATSYVQQLEEAGIISSRYERTPRGLEKICYTIYDGISLRWLPAEERSRQGEYVLDVPVGHYTYIECGGRSFLADQAQIIASPESVSRFFNPIRMSGELLGLGSGSVRYLFPYNLSGPEATLSLTLSLEVACAVQDYAPGATMTISLNGFALDPVHVVPVRENFGQIPALSWLPQDMPTSGSLLTIRVTHGFATVNSHPAGKLALPDLDLCPTRPVELRLDVEPNDNPNCGVVVFGRHFGKHQQDIRMTIRHDASGESQ